ncbi:MAG TPA: DUF1707 domain-containing protein [Pseudonocardiaceae bacterium]|nr:DUF1707 domain-containing protein [Pseudonocardiaceae bacterium]
MTDPKALRVSDAEREHVVGLLQKAIGQGLIDIDEFTTRTDTALAARTRGELNAVLLDLPGMVNKEAEVRSRDRVELTSTMSSISRKGVWTVPRELVVRNRMGSTELDFREARIPHAVVDIELDVTAGSVKLMLPEGASVNTEDVQVSAGSLKDEVGPGEGRPHFVLRGSVRAGSVEIRQVRRFRGFRITRA